MVEMKFIKCYGTERELRYINIEQISYIKEITSLSSGYTGCYNIFYGNEVITITKKEFNRIKKYLKIKKR